MRGVRYDSREVVPGDVFVCIRGHQHDGHAFAGEAAGRGAVMIVTERPLQGGLEDQVPTVRVGDSRSALAIAAAAFFGHPDRALRLVGVTGTNGKTTTTFLTRAVLEAGGYRTGLVGTVLRVVGDEVLDADRTTPESSDMLELFSRMVQASSTHAVTEVSSHAVVLRRLAGIEYDVGIFTNLTQDHLDFHGTMEAYRDAKAAFFASLTPGTKGHKLAIVNGDDPSGEYMAHESAAPVVRYGLDPRWDVTAEQVRLGGQGASFLVKSPWGQAEVRLKLSGRFNVYNALGALAAGLHEGVPLERAVLGLERVEGVPGRFEAIREGQPFEVIVDYAHTPDGLENILKAARDHGPRQVWVVFGCGGDRDRGKRPIMGSIAARLAERVVITSDNPRSEEPESICREIERGVLEGRRSSEARLEAYEVVVDRRQAIEQALRGAAPGDMVVIAGKGHETYQVFRDRVIHFDDREVVREVLRRMGYGEATEGKAERRAGA
ncbi:MAG: UDP-N-acetylmuramoyl-L-alanyl-D-glutamate--2,6-diaminopimelate ligase [Limnochordaceae bacterium]|nr:UDP-N-acetylmuramoyl-L-alanyl-D-glutamate--2,6-diaminopimelate ligase [Limnochordaceae bacterium]